MLCHTEIKNHISTYNIIYFYHNLTKECLCAFLLKHQHWGNNNRSCKKWDWRITGEERVDRRMNDLREEIGMQYRLTGRIVRSWMMWAGHFVQTKEADH